MAKLTAKQQRFCDEYLIDLNATQAAIRAGYSKKTARAQGQRMLTNVDIETQISKLQKKRKDRVEITQDRVLQELAYIAFAKATDYARVVERDATVEVNGQLQPLYNENGERMKYRTVEPILTDELTEEQKRAIAVIKKGRDGFEIKPYSKDRALELLGKHLGMFTDRVELSGKVNDPFADLTTEDLKKLIDE